MKLLLTLIAITEKPVDQVTPQERTQAKRLVYGITYGMGSQSLAELLSVSVKEARLFQRQFLEAYPAVQKWMHETIAHAQRERVRFAFYIVLYERKTYLYMYVGGTHSLWTSTNTAPGL